MAVKFRQGVFSGDNDPQDEVAPVSDNNGQIKFYVEVYREYPDVEDIYKSAREVDVVRPGGTVVNIGAGPSLPSNPYEGQVWILT